MSGQCQARYVGAAQVGNLGRRLCAAWRATLTSRCPAALLAATVISMRRCCTFACSCPAVWPVGTEACSSSRTSG
ncbi:hypothetical protein SALBM311S_08690 [Streptomyces alboniger]